METIKFVVYSTLLLAIAFGIAWPGAQWAIKNVEKWDAMPGTRKLIKSGLLVFVGGLVIIAGIIDIFVNYTAGTLVFWELPAKGDKYLTKRLQHYLNLVSGAKRPEYLFNRFQWLYIKFVVKTANRIDKTPHFRIPANIVKYF